MNRIRNSIDTLRRRLGWTPLRVAARLTIACLLLSFLGSSRLATIGRANSPTTAVSINPASQEVCLGTTAVTDILVENMTDLYGFEFKITFDPTLVEVVDADPTMAGVQIQPGDFLSPDWLLENSVDNNSGTIRYALCQLNPSPPQSGDGVLATIIWRGKVMGTSPIAFTHVLLAGRDGIPIPADTQDGQITVEEPSIELTKEADPTVVNPGDTVDYTISVENTGNPDLTNVTVDDHLEGCTLSGPSGDDGDGVLEPGETWTYSCSITAGEDDIENTATVEATDEAGETVSDSDTATVQVKPLPTITSLSPVSATVGGPAFTLIVNGTDFVSGSIVQWGGSARTTTFVSSTQLTADITGADVATAGTVNITVVNPAPGGGTSNALPFEITEFGPVPPSVYVYLPLVSKNAGSRLHTYLPLILNND